MILFPVYDQHVHFQCISMNTKYRRHTDLDGSYDQNEIKWNKLLNSIKQNCPIFWFAIQTFFRGWVEKIISMKFLYEHKKTSNRRTDLTCIFSYIVFLVLSLYFSNLVYWYLLSSNTSGVTWMKFLAWLRFDFFTLFFLCYF